MARRMSDTGEAFRLRVTFQGWQGQTQTIYEGPYAAVGAAKSRRVWAERIYKDRLVEAVVEKTATNWEPVS